MVSFAKWVDSMKSFAHFFRCANTGFTTALDTWHLPIGQEIWRVLIFSWSWIWWVNYKIPKVSFTSSAWKLCGTLIPSLQEICDLPEIKDLEPLHKIQEKYILISNKIVLSLSLSHVWLCFLRMSLFWMMGVEKFCTQMHQNTKTWVLLGNEVVVSPKIIIFFLLTESLGAPPIKSFSTFSSLKRLLQWQL